MIEVLFGVNVTDDAKYTAYRAEMTPLLGSYEGRFEVDVRVAEVLRAPGDKSVNRLFTIRFPSIERMDAFFSDPSYLAVRRRLFESSVSYVRRFGKYQVLE
jgi:uncharacterized protein (DUF1330 family)